MLLIYIRISFFLQISKLKLQAATAWGETTDLMLSIWPRLHSRHWMFTGKIVINGKPMDITLMQIVKSTLQANPNTSVIGFEDNSSAIKGFLRLMRDLNIFFTAETHNFPCAVAPYPGAETAGGRIRDTPGYCVGNLNIEGSYAPWKDPYFTYPSNLPLIQGCTRTFGIGLPNGERREWLKPIMFSGGIGQIDHIHITKGELGIGMLVVKIGGPAYRIGMGGGAASSMVSGQSNADLDFNAGAGVDCNVVKEIIYPEGAEIDIRAVVVDHKMTGRAVLVDSVAMEKCRSNGLPDPPPAVDLELEKVLGDMPQKTFEFYRVNDPREALDIAPGITVMDALKRVLRLPSVCSKRFLTTKVDRCVTDLVAQQQTVGPLQITLADVAVIAQIYTDVAGGACAIGEHPLKGLMNPRSMARLAIGEALTNLVWARVTSLSDVSLSDAMIKLGIAIDGGKDRLSMAAHSGGEVVKAPGNLVISVYLTPDLVFCFLMWQYPWYPHDWNVDKRGPSPWLKMFQNARDWYLYKVNFLIIFFFKKVVVLIAF
ncbi:hypothetical protein UlMin_041957 [Ulmus minor]